MWPWMYVLGLSFFQNISFSIVSRARNRNNMTYIVAASSLSNVVWFLTFRELVRHDMNFFLLLPYTIGTVSGSVMGAKVSMFFERRLKASSDSHLAQ